MTPAIETPDEARRRKHREYKAAYLKTDKGRESHLKARRKWNAANPEACKEAGRRHRGRKRAEQMATNKGADTMKNAVEIKTEVVNLPVDVTIQCLPLPFGTMEHFGHRWQVTATSNNLYDEVSATITSRGKVAGRTQAIAALCEKIYFKTPADNDLSLEN